MSNGKAMKINLIALKKTLYKMSWHFPKPYEPFGGTSILKLIYLIMQQKQILKKQKESIRLI